MADWKAEDPVARFAGTAVERGWLDEGGARDAEAAARARVAAALAFARSSPFPEPADLVTDVDG